MADSQIQRELMRQAEASLRRARALVLGDLRHSARAAGRRGPARGARSARSQAGSWAARGRLPAVLLKIHQGGRNGDRYAARSGRTLDQNLGGLTARDRQAAWDQEQARRPRLKGLVAHVSLSRPPGHPLSDEQWRDLAHTWLQEVGADGVKFVLQLHDDKPHHHVHLVFSRMRPDGRVVSDSNQRWRWREALRRAEARLGLTEIDRPKEAAREVPSERAHAALRRSERRKTVPASVEPAIVRAAIARSQNPEELRVQLAAVGVELQVSRRQDGTARGLLLRRAGADEWLAGTSVARDLSMPRVTAALEENARRANGVARYSAQAHPREAQQPVPRPRGG